MVTLDQGFSIFFFSLSTLHGEGEGRGGWVVHGRMLSEGGGGVARHWMGRQGLQAGRDRVPPTPRSRAGARRGSSPGSHVAAAATMYELPHPAEGRRCLHHTPVLLLGGSGTPFPPTHAYPLELVQVLPGVHLPLVDNPCFRCTLHVQTLKCLY